MSTQKHAKKRAALRDAVCVKFAPSKRPRVEAFVDRKLTADTLVEPPIGSKAAWHLDLEGRTERPRGTETAASIVQALVDLYRSSEDTPAETTVGVRRAEGASPPEAAVTPPVAVMVSSPPAAATGILKRSDTIARGTKRIEMMYLGYHLPITDELDAPFEITVRGRVSGCEPMPAVRTTVTYSGDACYALGPEADDILVGRMFETFEVEGDLALVIVAS